REVAPRARARARHVHDTARAGLGEPHERAGQVPGERWTADLVDDHRDSVALGAQAEHRLDEVRAAGAEQPRGAGDGVVAAGPHDILPEHATGARDEEAHGAPMDSASAPRGAARDCRRRLGELADLEDLRAAVRARALDRGTTVLHGHLLRVLDLDLLAFLDAVTLSHHRTSFGGSMALR